MRKKYTKIFTQKMLFNDIITLERLKFSNSNMWVIQCLGICNGHRNEESPFYYWNAHFNVEQKCCNEWIKLLTNLQERKMIYPWRNFTNISPSVLVAHTFINLKDNVAIAIVEMGRQGIPVSKIIKVSDEFNDRYQKLITLG